MGVMDKKKHKNQLFYSYNQWEDYQFGMYEEEQKGRKNRVDRAILMLSDEYMCRLFMKKVCNEWIISCKQNFTNPQMNKIAWLGQAACCLYAGIHEDETREAWSLITQSDRDRANAIAEECIQEWRQKNGRSK